MKPPSLNEVTEYMLERQNGIDPEHFWAFYEANGWRQGCKPLKSWKHAVITWEKRERSKPKQLSIIDRLTDRSWIN